MDPRQRVWAAARLIVPALVLVAAGPPSAVHAQSGAEVIVPGAQQSVGPADRIQTRDPKSQSSGAVFDAPNMPGVRMMAPIPDAQPAAVEALSPPSNAAVARSAASGVRRSLFDQTVAAAKNGEWTRARRLAGETGSRSARFLVEWLYLTDGGTDPSFGELNAFLGAHPSWPRRDTLIRRAEAAMPMDADPRAVIDWYRDRDPITPTGMLRFGEALIVSGNSESGMRLIRRAWSEGALSPAEESAILATHGDILRETDHRARLEQRLALDDIAAARRQISRVDADARLVAEARLRLKTNPDAVTGILASLPGELRDHRGLLQDAARAHRRRGQTNDAMQVLQRKPDEGIVANAPEQWWTDRHALAREALKNRQYQLAYDLVSNHGTDSGAGFADAEFLSGWVALRFLNKPDVAFKHFQALANGVSLPISLARAHYWSGRAEEALQRPNEAIAQYRRAAQHGETYYGQLALARLDDNPTLRIASVSEIPSRAEEAAFEADERVGVIRVLAEARDRSLMRMFAVRIANDDPPDAKKLHQLAQLMVSVGDRAMSVRVAKLASYNGVLLLSHLAPVISLPKFPGSAAGPDPALVLGITRQESEFDVAAVSSAGARGLMQLMPATARRAASMNRMGFKLADLTANPGYNMQLGMATLDDYLAYWSDSYVLGIASYNAGPSNVRKWVEANGDPRDSSVDPIDWIELIPFSETRNYVQRVLENLSVYRNRLSGSEQRLAILTDLYRPKLPNRVVLKEQAPAPADVPMPVRRPATTALQ